MPINLVLVSTLLAACILTFVILGVRTALASYEWHRTQGIIALGDIDEFRGQVRIRGRQLLYSYYVDGREFTSNRVYAPVPDNLLTYAVHFHDTSFVDLTFEDGQFVDVFYNPVRPSMSCLAKGGTKYVIQESVTYAVAAAALVGLLW